MMRSLTGHTGSVYGVDWSPNGSRIVSGSDDRTIKIWDAETGNVLMTMAGPTGAVSQVKWSPDGNKIASACDYTDKTVKIWDPNTGVLLSTLTGNTNSADDLEWSPDGTKILCASDKVVRVWYIDAPTIQTDISDAVFSIIAPEPVIQVIDVDMGKVVVGDYKDNNEPSVICNRGAAPLHVLGLDVTSGDTQDFMISRGAGDFSLPAGDCQDITFTFTPTKVGKRSAKATLRTTVGDFADTITIHGEGIAPLLQVETPMVYFGRVLVGTMKDTLVTVTIRNVGTAPLVIQDTHHDKPNDKDFTTLAGGGSFTLAPGATHPMQLRFVPSDEGRTTGLLSFEYNGPGSPALLQLIGEGFRPDSGEVTLVAGTASAFPGEQTDIPITLILPQNSTLSTVTGFDVTLRYNATLLFPADNSMTTITSSGNDALLTFFAPYNPAGGELLRVPFIATLGDDTTTAVKIEKAVPRVGLGKVDVATRDGSFALKGVCYAGGAARLYKPSGRAMLMAIRPNPAEDEAEIEYETSETGVTSLKIVNALGMEVSVPVSAVMEAGFHVAKVRTSDFGAGTYFVVMTTPTERHVTRFEVVR